MLKIQRGFHTKATRQILCTGKHCSPSVLAAPHRSSKWLRAGCRAAAGGGSSHGPERFRWMAASSCCGVLGSGKVNITGNRKEISAHSQKVSETINIICCCCCFKMHVAELLVSHGASLNAKTFLEETPIGTFTPQHSLINTPGGRGVKKTNVSAQQGLIYQLFYITGLFWLNAELNLNLILRHLCYFHN